LLRGATAQSPPPALPHPSIAYRLEPFSGGPRELRSRFTPQQIALLEDLNRCDVEHLARLDSLVVPDRWDLDELAYSPLPAQWPFVASYPKFLVVDQPLQVFGAYEHGRLVRWGPVSTGRRTRPTPTGLFHLNWKSRGRHSTVDANWFMHWYFNFNNRRGLSLHLYELPGYPESHACIRLLKRDAEWIFNWGEEWQLGPDQRRVIQPGTPLFVVGQYGFAAPPPWRSPEHGRHAIELPTNFPTDRDSGSSSPEE
jgi:L,D-transpeptidase catalytic domain